MSRPKFHPLRVTDVRRETAECVSVAFEVPAELKNDFRFSHGQYLTLRTTINGEDVRRSYSICSGTDDGELRVAVKEVDGGLFSTWVNRELKAGDEIQVMTPMGNFTVPIEPAKPKKYLLIAAGSGITPVMSIARTVLRNEPGSEVVLLYGNRLFSTIIFRDALEDLKDRYLGRFRVFHILSREPNEIPLFHGRLNGERLAQFDRSFVPVKGIDEFFLCGPQEMIESCRDYLLSQGIDEAKVHFELFLAPNQATAARKEQAVSSQAPAGTTSVKVIFDGQETNFDMERNGLSVLEAAQRHGLDIPFSCKGGMCCTCRAHLDEGTVHMEVNYALEPGEIDAGFVLTCQSKPTSERVVVNFDQQ
ncbi:MAG: hypothetical protein RL220_1358 [Bacteroidota bacterium]